MLRHLLGLIVVLVLSLPGIGSASELCGEAMRFQSLPPQTLEAPCTDCFQIAEGGSNKNCTEGCMAQCRNAMRSCSGSGCNAQFQICARRCVVSCGSR